MKYRVEWESKAQIEKLEIWATLDSARFSEVRRSVKAIERRLSIDPTTEGESRAGNVRITFDGLIAVLFVVNEDDRLVSVTTAWLCR